jgi:hypothetical protein
MKASSGKGGARIRGRGEPVIGTPRDGFVGTGCLPLGPADARSAG